MQKFIGGLGNIIYARNNNGNIEILVSDGDVSHFISGYPLTVQRFLKSSFPVIRIAAEKYSFPHVLHPPKHRCYNTYTV